MHYNSLSQLKNYRNHNSVAKYRNLSGVAKLKYALVLYMAFNCVCCG